MLIFNEVFFLAMFAIASLNGAQCSLRGSILGCFCPRRWPLLTAAGQPGGSEAFDIGAQSQTIHPRSSYVLKFGGAATSVKKTLDYRVKTPCVGICSTGIGDSVCRGCKRFAHEVIDWNSYSEAQKRNIDQRLEHFLAQIVETKLRVVDQQLLQWHLDVQQIRYPPHKSPYIWAYELLRAGASQIDDMASYGLQLDAQYRHMDLRALRLAIDTEFYILSEAHYQRYFQAAGRAETEPGIQVAAEGA